LIAGDIARSTPDAAIASLKVPLAEMQNAFARDDLESYLWANVEFHERNTQIANNRTVKRIIDSLLLRTLPLRRLSLSQPDRMRASCDDHVRLLRAYEERDPNLAAALIRSNHMSALATLEVRLGNGASVKS
jgi:DNA-binding GntR family transcriptional regulator